MKRVPNDGDFGVTIRDDSGVIVARSYCNPGIVFDPLNGYGFNCSGERVEKYWDASGEITEEEFEVYLNECS
jgi:hypothetical protein